MLQADNLSDSLVNTDSLQELYERIHTNNLGRAFTGYKKLSKCFLEGPNEEDLIDIVLVTPESASQCKTGIVDRSLCS